jgi:nicotinamidase-related amidase
MYPNAPFIQRRGEVDAWDNADFRAAVQATGKKQVVLAGITTDVCMSQALPPRVTFHADSSF